MMLPTLPLETPHPVLLIGGGPVPKDAIAQAHPLCPIVVAADGGADAALRAGLMPDLVIGDLDSISQATRQRLPADCLWHITEQDSTDFDKALRNIHAPLVIGVGFLGGRLDHSLAGLSVLLAHSNRPCVLIGQQDVVCAVPAQREIVLDLDIGMRVSLYPLAPVRGRSTGLRWPVDGLDMAPDGRIGTSNEAVSEQVTLWFDRPGMVVLLPRRGVRALLAARLPDGADVLRGSQYTPPPTM